MASCTRCWRQTRPKFKQHILALYPDAREEQKLHAQFPHTTDSRAADYSLFTDPIAQPRNISDLTYYAQMFPNRLARIGRYLLKKQKYYNSYDNPRFVHLSTLALIGLVDSCHSDDVLVLYDESVCEAIRIMLVHPRLEHRILGAQSLTKLMSYIDDAADFRKYEPFFPPLVALCQFTDVNRVMQERVRIAGLRGMNAMVIHFYPARLVDHFNEIIPALLANIDTVSTGTNTGSKNNNASASGGDSGETLAASIANDTLSLIASKVSIPDLDSALQPIFASLDQCQWRPYHRSASIMQLLTSTSQSDLGDLILFELLKHGLVVNQSNITLKSAILVVSAQLIALMRVNVLHWEGMCDLLTHHSITNITSNSNTSTSTNTGYHTIDKCIDSLFAQYAMKLPLGQDVIAVIFHLTQLIYQCQTMSSPLQSQSHPHSSQSTTQWYRLSISQRGLLAESLVGFALSMCCHWQCDMNTIVNDSLFLTSSLASTETLVRALLACITTSHSASQRYQLYECLVNLLLPPIVGGNGEDTENSDNDSINNLTTGSILHLTTTRPHTANDRVSGSGSISGQTKVQRFLAQLHDGKLNLTDGNWLQMSEKDQRWLLTVIYYELTGSIGATDTVTVTSVADETMTVDSVVVTLLESSINQTPIHTNVRAIGHGSTTAHCYSVCFELLTVLLYHSLTVNLCVQWPLLATLARLTNVSAVNQHRLQTLMVGYLYNVSKLMLVNDMRESAADIETIVHRLVSDKKANGEWNVSDVAFDLHAPQRGLYSVSGIASGEVRDVRASVPIDSITALLVSSIPTDTLTDANNDGNHDSEDVIHHDMTSSFELYTLKYLPPLKLFEKERENSWAPSQRPNNGNGGVHRDRTESMDDNDSLTRVESPFHSPRAPSRAGTEPRIVTANNVTVAVNGAIVSSTSTTVTDSDDGKSADYIDQSYQSIALMCNRNSTRHQQQFRQSMRVFVDEQLSRAISHPQNFVSMSMTDSETARLTPTPPSAMLGRRRSLSSRRRSFPGVSVTSKEPTPTGATSDKFFAAPAIVAPPTLNVNAAIRQQIENSYALSPSHAVSGSVNIKTEREDGAGAGAGGDGTLKPLNTPAAATGSVNTPIKLSTPARTSTVRRQSSRSSTGGDLWSTAAVAASGGDDASVAEADEDDSDTDAVVYGLTGDTDALTHLEGTGENILKFHFPELRTFDSYLPAELDA